jgi:hypothetical protein
MLPPGMLLNYSILYSIILIIKSEVNSQSHRQSSFLIISIRKCYRNMNDREKPQIDADERKFSL